MPGWMGSPTIAAIVIAIAAVKLLVAANTDLVRDEAYYALWSTAPAPGYLDHPPAIAWFIAAGRAMLPDGELAVRLTTILSTIAISAAVWRIGRLGFDDLRIAPLAVLWFNLSLAAGVGLFVATPDAPSALFWALCLWCGAELARSGAGWWWIAFGVFAGPGLQTKYTNLFLGAGIVLWLAFYPQRRRWFADWRLWAGGVAALALFAPNVAWNAQNGWATFIKQFGRSGSGFTEGWAGLRYIPEFIAGQAGFMLPALFLFSAAGLGLWARRRSTRGNAVLALLVWTTLPLLAYFMFHGTHSRVQGNWTMPLVAPLALIAAWAAIEWRPDAPRFARLLRFLRRWHAPFAALVLAVVFAHAWSGWPKTPFRDPTAEMHGWRETARTIERAAKENDAAFIATLGDYGMTGWLATYQAWTSGTLPVEQLDQRIRYRFLPAPDARKLGWPALLVTRQGQIDGKRMPARLKDVARRIGTVERRRGDDTLATYDLWLLDRPPAPVFVDE